MTALDELETLLATWRASYDEAIGARIEAVGATAPALALAPHEDPTEAARAWCTAAADTSPAALSPLLQALDELYEQVRSSWAVSCLELVADRRPDPRLATFALRYLSDHSTLPQWTRRLAGSLLSVVERHGDLRAAAALENLSLPTLSTLRVRSVATRIRHRIVDAKKLPIPAPPSPSERAAGEALLAAIYEDPDDDARRLVYADWLLERDPDDPRGRLIAVQIHRETKRAGTPGAGIVKALDDLRVTRHARDWYAPILRALEFSSMVFERGFLARCAIAHDLKGPGAAALFERVEWGTVRELRLAPAFQYTMAMRALKSMTNVATAQLQQLASVPDLPRLDHLEVVLDDRFDALLGLLGRTSVRSLAIASPVIDVMAIVQAVGKTTHGTALESLDLVACKRWSADHWTWQPLERSKLRRLVLPRLGGGPSRLELLRDEHGWTRARVHVHEARHLEPRKNGRAWSSLLGILSQRPVDHLEIACVWPPQLETDHPVRQLAAQCARTVVIM